MDYKEVEGIDENGNPTTFKIEIPSAKEQLKELKQSCENHMGTIVYALQEDRFNLIEQALDEGEKTKEVLDIIIKKRVDINFLYRMLLEWGGLPYNTYGDDKKALKEYNECNEIKLTETEFNKIKECL